ncbi:MAG TPA: tRNA lysidine(34) synthetase TilS, partial [Nitrospirota bacterium]|nr:tRNA lysidine(34) synthetase TilS [Nitrospirota bacterium]
AGMGGRSKKLQDYFVDEKIPRHERDTVPILLSGNDVLWVVGLRTDNRFLPGKGTKRVLMVQVRREQK